MLPRVLNRKFEPESCDGSFSNVLTQKQCYKCADVYCCILILKQTD